MEISNIQAIQNFTGFKDFVYDTDLSYNEKRFVNFLQNGIEEQLDRKNGKIPFYPDEFISPETVNNYDVIDIYGDIYRDANNKNEVFLKLRIKPTPNATEVIKNNALNETARKEIEQNPLITEFVSQPIAVRSKSAYSAVMRNIEEKIAFFKRYITGIAKWKTTTKDLLKSSDKPKFGWDRDLIEDYNRAESIAKMTNALNFLTKYK